MPLPIVLWGAAAALGATGLVKGIGAVSDINEAKEIGERAEYRYKRKQDELDTFRHETNEKFEQLGLLKIEIFNNQIKHIVDVLKKTATNGATTR